jgi:hypothetical protein
MVRSLPSSLKGRCGDKGELSHASRRLCALKNKSYNRLPGRRSDQAPLARIFNACRYPNFCAKRLITFSACRSGRQSKAWGGARQRSTPGFTLLSLPTILREMSDHNLSLRSRRQNRAWGGASAEPQEYGVNTHQAREAGGSYLLFAISSSLRLIQWLSPASAGLRNKSHATPGVPLTLHPRLYSNARVRGLRYNIRALCKKCG